MPTDNEKVASLISFADHLLTKVYKAQETRNLQLTPEHLAKLEQLNDLLFVMRTKQ